MKLCDVSDCSGRRLHILIVKSCNFGLVRLQVSIYLRNDLWNLVLYRWSFTNWMCSCNFDFQFFSGGTLGCDHRIQSVNVRLRFWPSRISWGPRWTPWGRSWSRSADPRPFPSMICIWRNTSLWTFEEPCAHKSKTKVPLKSWTEICVYTMTCISKSTILYILQKKTRFCDRLLFYIKTRFIEFHIWLTKPVIDNLRNKFLSSVILASMIHYYLSLVFGKIRVDCSVLSD